MNNNNLGGKIFQIAFGVVFIIVTLFIIGSAFAMGAGSIGPASIVFVIVGILFVGAGVLVIVQAVKGPKSQNFHHRNDISNIKTGTSDYFSEDITTSYKVVQNFCNNCGTKITDKDTYCPGCGKKISRTR